MREGGLHGNLFDTTTGEVVLYTGAGEGAGIASGAVDKENIHIKLKLVADYMDLITNIVTDKEDKQILIDYFKNKVIPKFNKGGPVELDFSLPEEFAGGGMAGIRRPSAIPPESGPQSQGLASFKKYGSYY